MTVFYFSSSSLIQKVFSWLCIWFYLLISFANAQSDPVELIVRNDQIECGTQFDVEIYVNNFEDVLGIQFSVDYDPNVLEFENHQFFISPPPATVNEPNPGDILVLYFDAIPESLPDGGALMSLTFNHTGPCDEPFIVQIADFPLPIEITADGFVILDHRAFGGVFLIDNECGLEVDAGEDQLICEAGDVVSLDGSITGDYYDFSWEPENLVDDPDNLSTTATVSGPTTFTLTALEWDENLNIVYNTHFDFGHFGMTSDYNYDEDDLSQGNTYTVASSPDIVYSTFPFCTDHTGNNGNMLIVNGIDAPPQNVWCQYIEVEENTLYYLEAFIHSLLPLNTPDLQFYIDGIEVGDQFSPSGLPCIGPWTQMEATWFSGSDSSIELCIYNHTGNVSLGNAFVLDDIAMIPLCEAQDEVEIIIEDPAEEWVEATICADGGLVVIAGVEYTSAGLDTIVFDRVDQCDSIFYVDISEVEIIPFISPPDELNCDQPIVELDASGSIAPPGSDFMWSTPNGNIIDGHGSNSITIDEAGTYVLVISFENQDLHCISDSYSVLVFEDFETPDAEIIADSILNCWTDTVTLNSNVFPSGFYLYNWMTSTGNIVGPTNQETVTVTDSGAYTLIVSNSFNGCADTTVYFLDGNTEFPIAHAGEDLIWTCSDSVLTLDGSGSSQGMDFNFSWSTQAGNIASSSDSMMVEVSAPGDYVLEVQNLVNGCVSIDSATVLDSTEYPELVLSTGEVLTCEDEELWVGYEILPNNMQFDISWTTDNGEILSSSDSAYILVSEAADYAIEVILLSSGCASRDTLTVTSDMEMPLADAGQDKFIDCDSSTVFLDGNSSDTGSIFSYFWTTSNGEIISGENALEVLVGEGGTYILEVQNTANGCITSDSVQVFDLRVIPEISFEAGDTTLNCINQGIELSAEVMPDSLEITYSWSTDDGNIIGSTDSASITLDGGGIYSLEVIFVENNCQATFSQEITIDTIQPVIDAGSNFVLNCNLDTAHLNGVVEMPLENYVVNWEGPAGGIVQGHSTLSPQVVLAGWYWMEVLDTTNGCISFDSVLVESDFEFPELVFETPQNLNCSNPHVALLISTDSSYVLNFSWETANGNIVGSTDSNPIVVDQAGLYVAEVLNTNNGCTEMAEFQVFEDFDIPVANGGEDFLWNCGTSLLTLDGSNSSQGSNIAFLWTISGTGNIESNPQNHTVEISSPGIYVLSVTDTVNQCQTTDTVNVIDNVVYPDLQMNSDGVINCYNEEIWLGFDLDGAGFTQSVNWVTNDGEILTEPDSIYVLVNSEGTYYLEVEFEENNCLSIDTVLVVNDISYPIVNAGPDMEISCDSSQLRLDGTGSENGPQFSYEWTTSEGNIIDGEQFLDPLVNQAGTYYLEVFDITNGCTSVDSVLVESSADVPTVNIVTNGELNCVSDEMELAAEVINLSGFNVIFEWSTMDGEIFGDPNDSTIVISQPGVYVVEIEIEETSCLSQANILIEANDDPPFVNAENTSLLNCREQEIGLVGEVNLADTEVEVFWNGPAGGIQSGESSLMPVVNLPGWYYINVMEVSTGCTNLDSVLVESDTEVPSVELLQIGEINCLSDPVLLRAEIEGNLPAELFWTTQNGNIVDGTDQQTIQIISEGTYSLITTFNENGCKDTSQIQVNADLEFPTADAGPDVIFNCSDSLKELNGSNSSMGNSIIYSWTTNNGNILTVNDQAIVQVTSAGTYYLEVTDTLNSCSDLDSVEVQLDEDRPIIIFNEVEKLNCFNSTVIINASSSITGDEIGVGWQSKSNFEVSEDSNLIIETEEAGVYVLSLVNLSNDCAVVDSIEIEEDFNEPTARIECVDCSPCDQNSAILDGSLSESHSNEIEYFWFASSNASFTAISEQRIAPSDTGTYFLEVLDSVNGCRDTASIYISGSDISLPMFDVSHLDCQSATGAIIFEDSALSDHLQYSIDGGQTYFSNGNFEGLSSGIYSLQVRDTFIDCVSNSLEVELRDDRKDIVIQLPSEIQLSSIEAFQLDPEFLPGNLDLTYSWTPGEYLSCSTCPNPLMTGVSESTSFSLLVESEGGCLGEASVLINIVKQGENVYIPNAFSPNEDGVNDQLTVFTSEGIQSIHSFSVFDRWGELVFKRMNFAPNDPDLGWNGLYRGNPMPAGVYLVVVEIEFPDSGVQTFTAETLLIR